MAGAAPYLSFEKLTRAALAHAAGEAGLRCSDPAADALMRAYDSLPGFADVPPALERLRTAARAGAAGAVVFSNGTPAMLARSVATSPTLRAFQEGGEEEGKEGAAGGAAPLFEKLISVDAVGKYKPAPDVYEFLQREAAGAGADYKAQVAVWLVSANPFDVVGARAAGLRAAWVDRQGTGWVDRLGDVIAEYGGGGRDLRPTIVARGVDEAVDKILDIGV